MRTCILERYQTVYLGFPIWGTTLPPMVDTFLSSHDLSNKRVIPFITHGGYGIGDSEAKLAIVIKLSGIIRGEGT